MSETQVAVIVVCSIVCLILVAAWLMRQSDALIANTTALYQCREISLREMFYNLRHPRARAKKHR